MGYNRVMPWDVIGHDWAVQLLQRHVAQNAVRHAYLFTGPEGVGKRTLALQFARALVCQSPPAPGDACGTCRACRLLPDYRYADLHVIESDDEGGSVKVEQVRELHRHLSLAPLEGQWRIALLLRFHQATPGAANALLKTLEEPPAKVVLLLTARSPEELLPTVVSRCEGIPLRALPQTSVAAWLGDQGVPVDKADLLSRLAGGSPGMAMRLAGDEGLLADRVQVLDSLIALLQGSRAERFAAIESMAKDRGQAIRALQAWQSLVRDALMAAAGAAVPQTNPDRRGDLQVLVARHDTEAWIAAIQALDRTLSALQGNANTRLALEVLALDLPGLR